MYQDKSQGGKAERQKGKAERRKGRKERWKGRKEMRKAERRKGGKAERRGNFPVESAAGGASRRGRPGLDLRARQSASHAPPAEHRRRRPAHRDRKRHTAIVFLR